MFKKLKNNLSNNKVKKSNNTTVGKLDTTGDILTTLKLNYGWIELNHEEWVNLVKESTNNKAEYKENVVNTINRLKNGLEDEIVVGEVNDKIDKTKNNNWINNFNNNSDLIIEDRWTISKLWKDFTDRLFVKRFENIKEIFQEWLDEMFKAWIINKKQLEEIQESLESPQVMESIRTWTSVLWFSGVYTVLNSLLTAPIAAVIGWPLAWVIAWLAMYFLKRVGIHIIVKYSGKHLDRKNYISNMSLIPVLWEQMALLELVKSHPLAAQYFFAFMKTKKIAKSYENQNVSTQEWLIKKEELRNEWKTKVDKNVRWIKKTSDWVVWFETSIWDFFTNTWYFFSNIFKKKDNNRLVE